MYKIFTFRFYYDEPADDFGEIEFCAESFDEAYGLFKEWAIHDEGCPNPNYTDCEVVYNADDAEEYGDEYGTPEEYTGI